jgi:Sigma-70, region 4
MFSERLEPSWPFTTEEWEQATLAWAAAEVKHGLRCKGVREDVMTDAVQAAGIVLVRMMRRDLKKKKTGKPYPPPWESMPEEVRLYLLKVAWNNVRSHHRWQERNGGELPPDALVEPARARSTVSDELRQIEALDFVRTALAHLTWQQREMIVAVDLDGMHQKAAAKKFNLAPTTFRSRYAKAKERFQETMHWLAAQCSADFSFLGSAAPFYW